MRREWIEIPERVSINDIKALSPSMRREWIEIKTLLRVWTIGASPSMRREWIEMHINVIRKPLPFKSPSMRREWIEINNITAGIKRIFQVSLHAEGVD